MVVAEWFDAPAWGGELGMDGVGDATDKIPSWDSGVRGESRARDSARGLVMLC